MYEYLYGTLACAKERCVEQDMQPVQWKSMERMVKDVDGTSVENSRHTIDGELLKAVGNELSSSHWQVILWDVAEECCWTYDMCNMGWVGRLNTPMETSETLETLEHRWVEERQAQYSNTYIGRQIEHTNGDVGDTGNFRAQVSRRMASTVQQYLRW